MADAALLLEASTVTGNSCENSGAGIDNFGTATVRNSTISDNSAGDGGGGIRSHGTLTLESSTVSGNVAGISGGGIDNFGSVVITNSTVSGNTAVMTVGGGIFSEGDPGESFALRNSTVTGNSAGEEGGGILHAGVGLTLVNTLVAENTAALAADDSDGPDLRLFSGTLAAQYSLIGTAGGHGLADGVDGNIVGANPKLGSLGDNGGPTQTHALKAPSPAIDAGTSVHCPATDQRGVARSDGGCDIGSYEREVQ